ncbi:hypothetical protein B9Z19DRAFT_1132446 [Tuber borchii]|uniref:C2H2-type domain-containing protein n=1 Tax=Tuber borchii TaxID=42251 RepID=A0A2T6ZH94_TUBBO|nr:hypothetical protein B9Z19DRAFT_1132446 [Tuber borchii]
MTLPDLRDCIGDWKAVSDNNFDILQPLPSQAESLPLYLDGDGFYSVNGPTFHMNRGEHFTAHLRDNQASVATSSSNRSTSHLCLHPINATHWLAVPLCASLPPIPISSPSYHSQHSLRTCPEGGYVCNEPGCTWLHPFRTKQGLTRHHKVKHIQMRYDCPIHGCKNKGNNGIKREDNLRVHLRDQHQVELPRESRRSHA